MAISLAKEERGMTGDKGKNPLRRGIAGVLESSTTRYSRCQLIDQPETTVEKREEEQIDGEETIEKGESTVSQPGRKGKESSFDDRGSTEGKKRTEALRTARKKKKPGYHNRGNQGPSETRQGGSGIKNQVALAGNKERKTLQKIGDKRGKSEQKKRKGSRSIKEDRPGGGRRDAGSQGPHARIGKEKKGE